MFAKSAIKYIVLFIIIFNSCNHDTEELDLKSKDIRMMDKQIYYKDKPYTGIIFSKIDTIITYKAFFVDGKKHGQEQKFFFNGTLAESGIYNHGKKIGKHQSWWNKNQLKAEYYYILLLCRENMGSVNSEKKPMTLSTS